MLKIRCKSAALLVLLLALTVPATVHAAAPTTSVSSGINISPAQLKFNVGSTANSQVFPLTITNNYNAPVSLSAAFSGIDENANLLIPSGTLDPSFASALSISQTAVTIPAHTAKILNVQATNLNSLAPGGHYATLVLTQQDVGGTRLSIKGAVSITIFVVKNPGAYQSIALSGVSTNHWLFRLPTTASLGFNNTGNVLVVPRASVLIFDHSGNRLLQKGVGNIQSYQLLPGNQLQTSVKVSSLANTWLPQKVRMEIIYRADGASQLSTATGSFWYIPPVYLLLLTPLGWYVWRKIDRYRRRGHPLPESITRVPPLGLMRRLRATTKHIFIVDHDIATPVSVKIEEPVKKPRNPAKKSWKSVAEATSAAKFHKRVNTVKRRKSKP